MRLQRMNASLLPFFVVPARISYRRSTICRGNRYDPQPLTQAINDESSNGLALDS